MATVNKSISKIFGVQLKFQIVDLITCSMVRIVDPFLVVVEVDVSVLGAEGMGQRGGPERIPNLKQNVLKTIV